MHIKYLFSSLNIRNVNRYLAVKASRTEQCSIQYIRSIGSRQYNNTAITTETIHFHKQLVKRIFALIIAHHYIFTSCAAYSIYLINKHYTWRFFTCLLEQVTDTARSHPYKQLHKIRTRHREERHLRF